MKTLLASLAVATSAIALSAQADARIAEPASLALVAGAFLGFGLLRRRA